MNTLDKDEKPAVKKIATDIEIVVERISKLIEELTLDVKRTVELEKISSDVVFQRICVQHSVFLKNNIDRLKGLYDDHA